MPRHRNSQAVKLIGSPKKLIDKLITDGTLKKWALEKITLEGPPHKQLQHTLVLMRLQQLVSLVEIDKGLQLQPASGEEIFSGEKATLPLPLPAESLKAIREETKVLENMTMGPEHEILFTTILLQVIEGLISSMDTHQIE